MRRISIISILVLPKTRSITYKSFKFSELVRTNNSLLNDLFQGPGSHNPLLFLLLALYAFAFTVIYSGEKIGNIHNMPNDAIMCQLPFRQAITKITATATAMSPLLLLQKVRKLKLIKLDLIKLLEE